MSRMGFGDCMSKLIYTLGEGSVSHVMINKGVIQPISIQRLIRHGWQISPFLFSIVAYPLLVKLHNMTMEEELFGLRFPSRNPCIVEALTNEHMMFLAPNLENIIKARDMWEMFSNVLGLG